MIFYDGKKYHPYASEGGHAGFTPGNQLEVDLWEHLYSNLGFIEVEDVLSLKGLERIYEFMLSSNRATKADWFKKAKDKASKIIEYGLSGQDEIAVKSLDLFVDCLDANTNGFCDVPFDLIRSGSSANATDLYPLSDEWACVPDDIVTLMNTTPKNGSVIVGNNMTITINESHSIDTTSNQTCFNPNGIAIVEWQYVWTVCLKARSM